MTFYGQRVALHHTRTNKHTYKFLVHVVRTLWGNLNFIKKAKWTFSSFIFSTVQNRPLLAVLSIYYYYTTQRNMSLSVPHCPPRWPARAITTPRMLIGHFFLSFFSLLSKQIELPLISWGSRRVTQKVKRKESSSTIHFQKKKKKKKRPCWIFFPERRRRRRSTGI